VPPIVEKAGPRGPMRNDDRLLNDRFGEFIARHERCVRDVIEPRVRDLGLREELVQTTFLRAYRGLAAIDAPERVTGWLAAIARNAVTDARRSAARRRRELPDVPLQELDELEDRAGARAARDEGAGAWIWEEVAQLDGVDRATLELRYREGLSYREMAARLRVPESTVRGRIFEARRALRRRLERKELEP